MDMLDEQDLQAIGQLLNGLEQKIDVKLAAQRKDIMHDVVTLMDAEFKPKFNLLAEGIQDIQGKMVPRSRMDDLEDEVKFLKSIIRQMNEDLQTLKKAQ